MDRHPPDWAISSNLDHADYLALDRKCYWDQAAGDRIVQFAHNVYTPQVQSGTGPFRLLPWQETFLRQLYSWRNQDGTRRFRYALLHIAKKNGKTELVSIMSAYELVASGERSPFVVTGSTSENNARQVYNGIKYALTAADLLGWCQCTNNVKRIKIDSLNAEYKALASDGDTVQGFNCSFVVLDECHAHKSAGLYDSLKYATRARPNGLVVCISTAGDDPSHWYHGLYSKAKRVIAGEDTDTTFYAQVYESHPDADPEDPAEWRKANPSLGHVFSESQFALELQAAKTSTDRSEWWRALRYSLNRWVRSDDAVYFDVNQWDKGKGTVPDLTGLDCWLGVDLSLSTDPSAVTAVWAMGDGTHYVRSWGWVCREGVTLRERTSLPRYDQYEAEGWLTVTDGDRIDDELILSHILDLIGTNQVKGVVFDPTAAIVMMGRVESHGVQVHRLTQSHRNYNGPMKELSKAIAEKRINHDGNNLLRYNLSCLRVHETRDGLIRPFTKKSTDHIDGAVALLMAYSAALQAEPAVQGGVVWV